MGGTSLPPGFRFHPTDEELVRYYLKRKVEGLEIELEVIPVVKLYNFDPWELPDKSFLPKHDMEWFFFSPRDRKYPNGSRTNRATNAGYWKATGKDRKVLGQSSILGYRKTLVFYRGRAPFGDRTCWVMHEYRLCDDISQGTPSFQGSFALCRVMKKKEQRTSYINREPKYKGTGTGSTPVTNMPKGSEGNFLSPIASYQTTPISNEATPSSFWVSPDLILDSSKEQSQAREEGQFGYFTHDTFSNPTAQFGISPSSSYSNFTEEDDIIQSVCMSPCLGDGSLMGFFEKEDDSYDWTNSLKNLKPF